MERTVSSIDLAGGLELAPQRRAVVGREALDVFGLGLEGQIEHAYGQAGDAREAGRGDGRRLNGPGLAVGQILDGEQRDALGLGLGVEAGEQRCHDARRARPASRRRIEAQMTAVGERRAKPHDGNGRRGAAPCG